MEIQKQKKFANGEVFAIRLHDGFPIETTDTFLPFYTKDAIGRKQNFLKNYELTDRSQRWMIGVSVMSGCPVGCKFCATASLKKWRNLTAAEIVSQVDFILDRNPNYNPLNSKEFKINYTRMGEPFLNFENVRKAIAQISERFPNTHHYVSTIGLKNSNFDWISENITLQISLHSTNEERRNFLIPNKQKMNIEELGNIKTNSYLKTTVNLTLVESDDFDISVLKKYFSPERFFIKLSPINKNSVSEKNNLGNGIIEGVNLL